MRWIVLTAVVVALSPVAGPLRAQDSAKAEFDVVSIKRIRTSWETAIPPASSNGRMVG